MRGVFFLLVLVCLGITLAVPSEPAKSWSPADSSLPSDTKEHDDLSSPFMKRNYNINDQGHYYYYHPVEELTSRTGLQKDKGDCAVLTILIPIIVITILTFVLTLNTVGLIPNVQLPQIQVPLAPLAIPLPGGTGRRKRSLAEDSSSEDDDSEDAQGYYENVPQDSFNRLTNFVLDTIERDDCSSRLVCETGRYVEGQTIVVGFIEFITPPIYESKMKIFRDSALNHSSCKIYQCGYMDNTLYD